MNRELMAGLAWGGGSLAVALTATVARRLGLVDSETVTRLVIGMNGLMIAWYGNQLPKFVVPNACAREIRWMAGWSMVLSGIIYTGVFAFAPIPLAVTVGVSAVVAGIAATIAYGLWVQARAKTA